MALLFQSLLLLIGLGLVVILGNKGYFINLCLGLVIIFLNQLLKLEQILFILGSAIGFYVLIMYLDNLVIKKYQSLPLREMIIGGSALSILVGTILHPLFISTVLGPVLGIPLLRRFAKLGYKALFLTFSGFVIRIIYSSILNLYIVVKLM